MKKLELIEEWRQFSKFWSVRLSLMGSAILSAFFAFPGAMIDVWNSIPGDLKSYIPAEWAKWIPVALVVLGAFARVVKQKDLPNVQNDSAEGRTEN